MTGSCWKPVVFLLTVLSLMVGAKRDALAKCDRGEAQIVLAIGKSAAFEERKRIAEQTASLINRDLQGRVCLTLLADEQRFADAKILEALEQRQATMALPPLTLLAKKMPAHRVFALPFAFRDRTAIDRFLQNGGATALTGDLPGGVLTGLAVVVGPFHQIASRKRLVNPEDALGVRFLDQNIAATRSLITAVRGIKKQAGDKGLKQVLEGDEVDAVAVTWERFSKERLSTNLKSVLETNHTLSGYQFVVRREWWAGLDAKLRNEIAEVVSRAVTQTGFETARRERLFRNTALAAGTPAYALSERQWSRWRAQVQEAWEDVPAQLLVLLQKANQRP